ncbi:MAG: hypothetical protein ACYC7F_13730, partial [Gemmatimonadaceae bacterium]
MKRRIQLTAARLLPRRAPRLAAVMSLFVTCSAAALAQEPLRVLDWLPREVARPSDVVTITFDRPVAGSLEHVVDAAQVVRITPALRARIEWRDPSTIRVVPREPLQPGVRYEFVVDADFTAFDGSRLAVPARFTLSVRGPVFAASVPYLHTGPGVPRLDPSGRLLLAFTAPVADSLLNRMVRLTTRAVDGCSDVRETSYHVVQQRPPRHGDPYEIEYARWSEDTLARRFHRVVELLPDAPLPEDCVADLALPSLDSLDAVTVRYPVRTARPFGVDALACQGDCQFTRGVALGFSAPVSPRALRGAVHFEPAAAFSPALPDGPVSVWQVAARLTPRMTYRVRVDSTLRDIYGRPVGFGLEKRLTIGDFQSDLGVHGGLVLVPLRPVPTIRVRHVNVDSIALLLMPVADADRARHLTYGRWWRPEARPPLRDTLATVVALHAPFNEERVSDVALPELAGRLAGRLVALQVQVRTRSRAPDATSATVDDTA